MLPNPLNITTSHLDKNILQSHYYNNKFACMAISNSNNFDEDINYNYDFEEPGIIDTIAKILEDNGFFETFDMAVDFVLNLTKDEQKGLFAIVSQNFQVTDYKSIIYDFLRTRLGYDLWLKLFRLKNTKINPKLQWTNNNISN
jgi:hypothetical protein